MGRKWQDMVTNTSVLDHGRCQGHTERKAKLVLNTWGLSAFKRKQWRSSIHDDVNNLKMTGCKSSKIRERHANMVLPQTSKSYATSEAMKNAFFLQQCGVKKVLD